MASGTLGRRSGSSVTVALVLGVAVLMFVLGMGPGRGAAGVFLLAGAAATTLSILRTPLLGVHAVIVASYASMGIKRAVPQLPMGLVVDALLVLLVIAIALQPDGLVRLRRLRDVAVLPLVVWMGYCVTQLLNPESPSTIAWFYAVRGIAGYMVFPLLIAMVVDTRRHLMGLVWHWAVWANLCAAWGIRQVAIGLFAFEQRWLAAGAYQTHLLHGKLRAFSFLSDTAQYGITMAFSFVFFAALATAPLARWQRIGCALTAVHCFYGCMVSGTRSAWIAVPVGLVFFAVLRRRWGPVVLGLGGVALVFCFLKFTYIGQSNYNIQRMRQAVSPLDDPSFLVRLENQRKLFPYLVARPLGGGIGSAGFWGQRFSPGTLLANTAMDSHFVRIAAEVGFAGLAVHVLALSALVLIGWWRAFQIRDPIHSVVYDGHLALFVGVFVASYSNQYLAQIPTAIAVYQGFALIILGPRLGAGQRDDTTHEAYPRPVRRPIRHRRVFRNGPTVSTRNTVDGREASFRG